MIPTRCNPAILTAIVLLEKGGFAIDQIRELLHIPQSSFYNYLKEIERVKQEASKVVQSQ